MPVTRALRASILPALLTIATLHGTSWSGSGTAGGGILELIPDAQSAGYSGNLMSLPDTAGAFMRNPAASAVMYRARIAVSDCLLPEGIDYRFAALCAPTPYGNFGIAAGYLGYGSIPGMTNSGTVTGTVDAKGIVAAFNYSRPVFTHGSARDFAGGAGISVKIVNSTLDSSQANAAAIDLGGIYALPFNRRLIVGAAVRNMGGKMKFISREDPLPTVFEIGTRYGDPANDRSSIMLGYGKNLVDDTDVWTLGAGYMPLYPVVLRAGWKGSSDAFDSGIRAGVGFSFNDVSFNYAVGGARNFDPVHWIGVDIGWGGISDPLIAYNFHLRSHFTHARDQYLRRDYIAARQEFEEILSMYPDHGPSKEYLGKISDELDAMDMIRMKKVGIYLRKANVALDRHDYMRSRRYYESVLGVDPENGVALKGLQKIDENIGRLQQEHSVRKNLGKIDRLWKEAISAFRQGELVESREKFQAIVDIDPGNTEARQFAERIDAQLGKVTELQLNDIFARGMEFYGQGDYVTAKKYFGAVLTSNPGRSDAQQYADYCTERLSEKGKSASSEKNTQLKAEAENEVEDLYSRGVMYYENGSFDEALKTLARSRDIALKVGMQNKAERARNTIADIRTSLGEERFKAGYELFQKNRFEPAAAEYRRALEYNPDYAPAKVEMERVSEILSKRFYEQGMKFYVANEPDKARAAFRKALSYNKGMTEAKRALDRMAK